MNNADYDIHMVLLDRQIKVGRHKSKSRIGPLQKEKVRLTAQKMKKDAERAKTPSWTPWNYKTWRMA